MAKEADVYRTLRLNEGKTPIEIRRELKEKNIGASYGSLYSHLENLVEKGYSRWQERKLPEEQLIVRGEQPAYEYFLTEDGYRKRSKYEDPIGENLLNDIQPA